MALPLKVLIWRAPKHAVQTANVFIKSSMSAPHWVGVRGWGGCPGGTHPHMVVQGQVVGMVVPGEATLPSGKGDLLVIWIRIPISYWVSPRCISGGLLGGCIQLMECNLLSRDPTISWCNLWSARFPRSVWRWCGVPPPWMGLPVGKCRFLLPPLRVEVGFWMVPHPLQLYRPSHGFWKGQKPLRQWLPHVRPCHFNSSTCSACCILSANQNRMIDLVAE